MNRITLPRAEPFGHTPDGQPASVHTLENAHLRVRITDYGGRMVSIEAPDKAGNLGDVLLGFDDATTYAKAGGAFGALLGRNANRIADGRFCLDGQEYQLPTNDGTSTLHGGPVGFDKVLWRVISTATGSATRLSGAVTIGDNALCTTVPQTVPRPFLRILPVWKCLI